MRLLIISHTPHYHRDQLIVGWGPTVREVDHLSALFERVVHIAPLYLGPAPKSALAYQSSQVEFRPISPAGGMRLRDKIAILWLLPSYIQTIMAELRSADIVHVRCPANISLIAILLLAFVKYPRCRWVKYAANWQSYSDEAFSYRFQRWWLKHRMHRGIVTVNGRWPNQPAYIHSFVNPCLTDDELIQARELRDEKVLSSKLRLIYVGNLATFKGVDRVLHILARLHHLGLPVTLDLAGDGPERAKFEQLAADLGVAHLARFHGWLPRPDLAPLYAQAHLMIFPSNSEGWPKVLSEGMAYGVVPVASRVSSIPQFLELFGTGRTFDATDLDGFTSAIAAYLAHPNIWKEESEKAIHAAARFSYTEYMNAIRGMLHLPNPHLYEQAR